MDAQVNTEYASGSEVFMQRGIFCNYELFLNMATIPPINPDDCLVESLDHLALWHNQRPDPNWDQRRAFLDDLELK